VKRVVDRALALGLRVPEVEAGAERLALRLDGEIDDGGRTAVARSARAGLEVVGGRGAAERHVHVRVRVDAAREDVLAGGVDGHVPRARRRAAPGPKIAAIFSSTMATMATSARYVSTAVTTVPPLISVRVMCG